jgi:hypothetical protein
MTIKNAEKKGIKYNIKLLTELLAILMINTKKDLTMRPCGVKGSNWRCHGWNIAKKAFTGNSLKSPEAIRGARASLSLAKEGRRGLGQYQGSTGPMRRWTAR